MPMGFFGLLTIVLLFFKAFGVINISWILVFLPIALAVVVKVLFVVVLFAIAIFAAIADTKKRG